jgi:hypothetical protein
MCPWDPGDFPETDAVHAAPHRPPNSPRHRFGRRGPDDEGEAVYYSAEGKIQSFTLILPKDSTSTSAARR